MLKELKDGEVALGALIGARSATTSAPSAAAEVKRWSAARKRQVVLRMDHGTQYTAEDFLKQIEFWGIERSFAFVAEPQTNGVVERFNRTFMEQALHGRIFRNLEEVRQAAAEFRNRYNRHWRLESGVSAKPKTGLHVTP